MLRNRILQDLLNGALEIAAGLIPYLGSAIGAINDIDQNKWLKRYHYISNLLIYGGLPDVEPL
ncbi:MAG: hypothetical protein PVF58_18830 [Candidatus Methanofastidiosia archaeon]|jgi:hypothetical protein